MNNNPQKEMDKLTKNYYQHNAKLDLFTNEIKNGFMSKNAMNKSINKDLKLSKKYNNYHKVQIDTNRKKLLKPLNKWITNNINHPRNINSNDLKAIKQTANVQHQNRTKRDKQLQKQRKFSKQQAKIKHKKVVKWHKIGDKLYNQSYLGKVHHKRLIIKKHNQERQR